MWIWLLVLLSLTASPFLITPAYAQSSINVTDSVPCFLNYTGSNYLTAGQNASTTGLQMLQNCDFSGDYLNAITVSFDWVTGGLLPLMIVTVLIVMTYLKYQNGIYPLAIGIVFLPIAFWAFPDSFISHAIIIGAIIGAGSVVIALIKMTKEY